MLGRLPREDQRGITGLETAIVLIAFVVVSSVFAFAALSTGLFASDKSKEAINAGLREARGTLQMRGAIMAKGIEVGTADGTIDAINELTIQVTNAAGGVAVDVTPGETINLYSDASQSVTLVSGDFTSTGLGSADSDSLVEPGEIHEIKITGLVAKLDPDLPKDTPFIIQMKPPSGAVLHIERTTPSFLETMNNLG